jgi:hypothetical protein
LLLGEACLGQSLFDYVGYTLERKLERVLLSREYLQFSSFRVYPDRYKVLDVGGCRDLFWNTVREIQKQHLRAPPMTSSRSSVYNKSLTREGSAITCSSVKPAFKMACRTDSGMPCE